MESILQNRIREMCDMQNIGIEKLSVALGMSASSVRKWGVNNMPSVDKVAAAAKYFDVSMDYLMGLTDIPITAARLAEDDSFIQTIREQTEPRPGAVIPFPKFSADALRIANRWQELDKSGQYTVDAVLRAEEKRINEPEPIRRKKTIPLFGNSFAAGLGEPDFGNALEEYEIDADIDADFAVRINGDSMEPYLHDDEIALGLKGMPKAGDVAAIMVDGAFYVKQIVMDSMGNLYLISANPKYDPIEVKASADSTVRCFGVIQTREKLPLP